MLELQTLPILPQGMARNAPQNSIGDAEAWTLIDGNLSVPGFLKRRGAVSSIDTKLAVAPVGLFAGVAPDGTDAVMALDDDAKVRDITDGVSASFTDMSLDDLFSASDALGGGTLVGASDTYAKQVNATRMGLALFRGALSGDVTKNLSGAVTRGDTTIGLSSGTGVVSGQFVFSNSGKLVGVVKSISGTTITLEAKALNASSSTVDLTVLRGLGTRTSVGRITTDSTSATVNGGGTKFKAQALDSGTWDLFTPDFTYIGTVSSVASDLQLTLGSSATVSLLNSDYIAIKQLTSYPIANTALGFITALYGGHQFYANGHTIAFSDDDDLEALDLTGNGNTLEFSKDPVRAMVSTNGALVVVTEKEAFALAGGVGTTPDRWRGERIHDDGTLCGMSALAYKGGAIWAGKRGVWYWDGGDPINLASRFGDYYRTLVDGVTRCWSAIIRDHLVLYLQGHDDVTYPTYSGDTSATHLALTVNLQSGAISLWTNVETRGFVVVPEQYSIGTRSILAMTDGTDRYIVDGDALITTQTGQDEFACGNGSVAGPYLAFETKKLSMGDGQRLKLFKQLQVHYFSDGVNLKVATVKGLNSTAVVSTSEFVSNSEFQDKRLKPKARSQYASYQVYESQWQDSAKTIAAVPVEITLGEFAVGFKWKRAGRV